MARFFCIFHALSFELNFFFDWRFPSRHYMKYCVEGVKLEIDLTLKQLRVYLTNHFMHAGIFSFAYNAAWHDQLEIW